jgi:hypothetical protein
MGTGERRAAQGSSQSVHSSEEAGNDRGAKGRRKMERRRRQMSEENLSAVTPAKEPKQDKEALRERWKWVEHTVWTDPMLRTLERGIKGGKWYALIDKVYEPRNLQSAYWKVWRNGGSAGIDGQRISSFEAREEQQLQQLAEELRTQSYQPKAVKRVWIPKPGSAEQRPLGIPTVVSYCTSFSGLWGSAPFNAAGAGNSSFQL